MAYSQIDFHFKSAKKRCQTTCCFIFLGVVAHGVHSLTLPDIQFYFPNNKTEIIMPIVNPDLLSFEPILFQPPDFQHSFSSPALRAVDKVLSHMNSPHFGMRLYTDLEKIVHATHMQDIWVQAGKVYQELQVPKSNLHFSNLISNFWIKLRWSLSL